MKWVAHMPQPLAAPAVASQSALARPLVAAARCNRLIAARLARKQTSPARPTSRKSCSAVRQENTRNMHHPKEFGRVTLARARLIPPKYSPLTLGQG